MADEADAAQRVENLQRDLALEGMRRTLRHLHSAGREDCEDCGFDIPQERREAVPGATRCTPCQTIHDTSHAPRR